MRRISEMKAASQRIFKVGTISLLFLIFVAAVSIVPASARVVDISGCNVGYPVTVSDFPEGAIIQFSMNGGTPVFGHVGDDGTVKYTPMQEGQLEIVVTVDGVETDDYTVELGQSDIIAEVTSIDPEDAFANTGQNFVASVTIKSNACSQGRLTVVTSGTDDRGYSLAGVTIVNIDPSPAEITIPVLVPIPPDDAYAGTYLLYVGLYPFEGSTIDPHKLIGGVPVGPITLTVS